MRTLRGAALIAISALGIAGAGAASASAQTFSFTGAEQTYTVPAGVHSIQVVAIGAKGGKGANTIQNLTLGGIGGNGDRVEAELTVSPRQVLFIQVGGAGGDGTVSAGIGDSPNGGFNGGGDGGGERLSPGGGGGGATDIRTCSRTARSCAGGKSTLESRLLVAGGGGGGGGFGGGGEHGGRGGDAREAGTRADAGTCSGVPVAGGGGSAGSGTTGGAGGAGTPNGNAGAAGTGGAAGAPPGGVPSEPGGGGGGGYFGGGAGGSGCTAGGGGGGSSFAGSGATEVTMTTDLTGVASVAITPGPAEPEDPPKTSNAFRFGKLVPNKRKGTARLAVILPGPGALSLRGKGLAPVQRSVAKAGTVMLPIKARGRSARLLNADGKLKLKALVTFKPTGGAPATKARAIKLLLLKR